MVKYACNSRFGRKAALLDSKQKNKDNKNFHNISAYNQHQKYYLNIIDEHPLEIKSPDMHFSALMNYLFAAKGYLLQRHQGYSVIWLKSN